MSPEKKKTTSKTTKTPKKETETKKEPVEKETKPTEAGCRPILFGWQAVPDDAREITICEGEIDGTAINGHP